jgi:hypothetical protein
MAKDIHITISTFNCNIEPCNYRVSIKWLLNNFVLVTTIRIS